MNFTTSVRIEKPVAEVFDYVSDPTTFQQWNSAVQEVRQTSGGAEGVGATYLMERELPDGRAENALEVVEVNRPTLFVIRTTSGPTPFHYRYVLDDKTPRPCCSSPRRSSSADSRGRSARSPSGP